MVFLSFMVHIMANLNKGRSQGWFDSSLLENINLLKTNTQKIYKIYLTRAHLDSGDVTSVKYKQVPKISVVISHS